MSGWLEGEKAIAGKGAMMEVRSGQGRAVLFAFRPQHRGQAHATFRLFFNAIHTSKSSETLSENAPALAEAFESKGSK